MADYKNIKGFNIQYLDSDPPNPIEGQMWFNSTSQTLKGAEVGGAPVGTWASGGDLNTARAAGTGAGTQTTALSIAGSSPGGRATNVESYNGSSWTEITDVNTARNELGGSGTQTAAIIMGGYQTPAPNIVGFTETWNGTSWTEVADLNTARNELNQSMGTQTANLVASGNSSTSPVTFVESWNGTSWTEVADVNTSRLLLGEIGTQTAGLVFGGYNPGAGAIESKTESWNGTSWTEVNDMNVGRDRIFGAGVQTDGLAYGGRLPPSPPAGVTGTTESWNGTSWTEVADMATARYNQSSAGTGTAALAAGGNAPPNVATTEEWNAPPISIKTFTTS